MTTSDDSKELTECEIRRQLKGKMSNEKIERYVEIQKHRSKRNVIINPIAQG